MYAPEPFAVTDAGEIETLLPGLTFGALITHGQGGLFASHLPVIYRACEGVLAGHLARANPHRDRAGEGEAMMIFEGASAYVSPNGYPSKLENGRVVPTWNYEVVHVYGKIRWRDETDWLLANVTDLTNRFEAGQPKPWAVSDAPGDFIDRLLRAVVGVELRVDRVEAKRKLSQNRSEADRLGVIATLAASPSDRDREMAGVMRLGQG